MKRWPQLRAGAIALVIGLGLVDGCPLPDRGHVPAWEQGFVEPIRGAQQVAEWPIAWLGRRMQVTQRWALYQAPVADRYRMQIDGRPPHGRWQTLYRAGDADHAELAPVIEHARVWGAWDPTDVPPPEYGAFARWIARRMFTVHEELADVRVEMEKIAIGHGEITGSGQMMWAMTVRR